MNKTRRAIIRRVISTLEDLRTEISDVLAEEQDALDNMPESLQYSTRYEEMEEAVDNLEYADDSFSDLIDYLEASI